MNVHRAESDTDLRKVSDVLLQLRPAFDVEAITSRSPISRRTPTRRAVDARHPKGAMSTHDDDPTLARRQALHERNIALIRSLYEASRDDPAGDGQ